MGYKEMKINYSGFYINHRASGISGSTHVRQSGSGELGVQTVISSAETEPYLPNSPVLKGQGTLLSFHVRLGEGFLHKLRI